MREICPKCGQNSITKRPEGRLMKSNWGTEVTIGSEYSVI